MSALHHPGQHSSRSGQGPAASGIDSTALDTALFAWEWTRVLVGTSWVAADRTQIAEQLRGLTRQLIEALLREPFNPADGIAVGESLVGIGYVAPEALGRTTSLIAQRFLLDLGLAEELGGDALTVDVTTMKDVVALDGEAVPNDGTVLNNGTVFKDGTLLNDGTLLDQDDDAAPESNPAPDENTSMVDAESSHDPGDLPRPTPPGAALPPSAGRPQRLAELLGMIGLGFVRAVRDRTLEQQEAIRASALLAWERARNDRRAGALQDPLTGLLNRNGFVTRLGQLIDDEPQSVVGVCLMTLEGFDALDRALGRETGDRLLVTVAARLARGFTGETELLARVGRNEFLVAGIDGGHAQDAVAKRLGRAQHAVRESIALDGRPVMLSTSFGVVARPATVTEPEQLLRDADLAASWARSRGPGNVAFFDAQRAANQLAELELAADLPSAVDNGQLLPYYQPIITLSTGRFDAVEALARWSHADRGLLLPETFLPLAERSGLMTKLGRSILRQACVQGVAWQDSLERPPIVAVNLAAVQVSDQQTVRDVVDVLEQTGLPAELLQLEITEHAALEEPATLAVIRDLARVGVGLALDDFGTGRAHLAQLPELPAHGVKTLKLPRAFLHQNGGSSSPTREAARLHVFSSVIDLAHGLDMKVTVEGVETAAQHALVSKLGADQAQGTYYAQPGTAATAGWLLSTRRPR
jgi:diguanylate cyclase (GGDEF)-like protein